MAKAGVVVGCSVDADTGVVTLELAGHQHHYQVTWAEDDGGEPVVTSLRIVSPEGSPVAVTPAVMRSVPVARLAYCARAETQVPGVFSARHPKPIPPVCADEVAAVPPGEVRAALSGLTVRQVGVLEAAAVAVAPEREWWPPGFFQPRDVGRGVSEVLRKLERRGLLELHPKRRPPGNSAYRVSALGLAVVAAVRTREGRMA